MCACFIPLSLLTFSEWSCNSNNLTHKIVLTRLTTIKQGNVPPLIILTSPSVIYEVSMRKFLRFNSPKKFKHSFDTNLLFSKVPIVFWMIRKMLKTLMVASQGGLLRKQIKSISGKCRRIKLEKADQKELENNFKRIFVTLQCIR